MPKDVADSYNARYRELISDYEASFIQEQKEQIDASIAMDTVRWGDESVNKYTIFNDACQTFDEGTAYLKAYFGIRYQLIDDILNTPGKYHQVEFVNSSVVSEYVSQRFWVLHGAYIPEDVMAYLAGRYESDVWLYEDGLEYQAAPVMEDIRLLSGEIDG